MTRRRTMLATAVFGASAALGACVLACSAQGLVGVGWRKGQWTIRADACRGDLRWWAAYDEQVTTGEHGCFATREALTGGASSSNADDRQWRRPLWTSIVNTVPQHGLVQLPPVPGAEVNVAWAGVEVFANSHARFSATPAVAAVPRRSYAIYLPLWLTGTAVSGLAALAGVCVRRSARLRRTSRVGRCRRCGYDLRATPGRCPECGTPA